jgi:glutaconyl-CoA/methylmalonyl-CoA decarboxylase subunit delta
MIMLNLYTTVTDSLFISLFSIIIVFAILSIITLVVQSLQYIHDKPKTIIKIEPKAIKKSISIEDIKDEDMMVAALVAAIDYQNMTQGDVKIVSIREIKET